MWDVATGRLVGSLPSHTLTVTQLLFSPLPAGPGGGSGGGGGSLLLSVSRDRHFGLYAPLHLGSGGGSSSVRPQGDAGSASLLEEWGPYRRVAYAEAHARVVWAAAWGPATSGRVAAANEGRGSPLGADSIDRDIARKPFDRDQTCPPLFFRPAPPTSPHLDLPQMRRASACLRPARGTSASESGPRPRCRRRRRRPRRQRRRETLGRKRQARSRRRARLGCELQRTIESDMREADRGSRALPARLRAPPLPPSSPLSPRLPPWATSPLSPPQSLPWLGPHSPPPTAPRPPSHRSLRSAPRTAASASSASSTPPAAASPLTRAPHRRSTAGPLPPCGRPGLGRATSPP